MIRASIIICTLNRPNELAKTLRGLLIQKSGLVETEVIIIDNSSDSFALPIYQLFVKLFPTLLYKQEPRLGLSYSRNRGLEEANGEWIYFLDDDAVPNEDWINNLNQCIDAIPSIGVIGGAVLPEWLATPPSWLTKELYPALSLCNYQGKGNFRLLDFPKEYPVGTNIAYPKKLLHQFDGFKPKFGRYGDLLLSGEETELNFKLHNAGYPIWYCPNAIVHHNISPDRLTRSFFRNRYYWSGRTWALLHQEIYGNEYVSKELIKRSTYGLPVKLARSFISAFFLHHNPFLLEVQLCELVGYIKQSLNIKYSKNRLQDILE